MGADRTALAGLVGLGALLRGPSGAAQESGEAAPELGRLAVAAETDAALEVGDATSEPSGLTAEDDPAQAAETELPEAALLDGVDRAEDLARSLPALRVDAPFLTNPNLYVRGIGQQHFYDDFAAQVAMYVDGMTTPSAAGQLLESYDLAGATLLKGAQGSLYARNATAGAMLLRSNPPDGEFSGTATLRFGNYDLFEVTGALGFPLLEEVLSARVAGAAHFRSGVTKNNCAGAAPVRSSVTTFDYSGNPLVIGPRYRLSGRVDYTAQLGRWGSLLPSFFFRYQSKTLLSLQRTRVGFGSFSYGSELPEKPQFVQPAFWALDARLAYRTPGERFEIAGWVRNLLDQHYRTDAFDQSIDFKQILYVYADPRLYGLSVSVQW